jgi:anti-anti-sigma regulatory factor
MAQEAGALESLAQRITGSAETREAVTGELKTNDRIIARVTDGIYREAWSAFRELISNAYDADATEVSIDCDYPFFNEIRITDNGNGMNEAIIGHLLQNIGGSSKRTAEGKKIGTVAQGDPTRSPAGRKLIGKIGIGLFAVAQLTQQFQIITKRKGEARRVSASIRLHTYQEDTLIDEAEAKNYSSGTFSVLAEDSPDLEQHGTTIILTAIRPAVRQKLQSQEIWSAIDENEPDDGSGLMDIVVPPEFNIGRLDDEGRLVERPKLPWLNTDAPAVKFEKLLGAAIRTARSAKEQANLAHFDNYLKMLWRVSVASPIKYIDRHPFDILNDGTFDIFRLSNKKKGAAEALPPSMLPLREELHLKAGQSDPVNDFKVTIDSVELRRPISLPETLQAPSLIERPMMFVGSVETSFSGATAARSGGRLSFEAYLYWNSRIIPKENIGAIVRVNDASGTLFDPEFLGYQVSEQTRKKQITCEIYVKEGLDGALNIDRESYNTSHPHFLYIQRWLHGAFRQFATVHKKAGKAAREAQYQPLPSFDFSRLRPITHDLDRITENVWRKMRGSDTAPPSVQGLEVSIDSFSVGDLPVSATRHSPTREAIPPTDVDLVKAISVVLDAHGVLESLSEQGRAELIFDLLSIFESADG